jgi:hypothetical protein
MFDKLAKTKQKSTIHLLAAAAAATAPRSTSDQTMQFLFILCQPISRLPNRKCLFAYAVLW